MGSDPIPRAVVRLVALEVALRDGGRGVPTVAEVARESGLTESEVELSLEVIEVSDGPNKRPVFRAEKVLESWHARQDSNLRPSA